MKIDFYSFGRIIIDGKTYNSDVIIYPDRVDSLWWRKEGHRLSLEDIHEVLAIRPDILIIGTGYSGVMKVPPETVNHLKSIGVEFYIEKTSEAVKLFNKFQEEKTNRKIIATLHLTC